MSLCLIPSPVSCHLGVPSLTSESQARGFQLPVRFGGVMLLMLLLLLLLLLLALM